jgi:hypothetical protein
MDDSSLLTRLLIAGGALGPLLFILVFLVEGATRRGYRAWCQMVSELCLGKRGWVQVANFLICGLLLLGFSVGLGQVLPSGPGALWGPILLGLFGLGLILSGLFVGEPHTPQGMIHVLAGLLVFSSLPLASFVLAWRFASNPAWHGWALYSLVTGVVVVGLFITTSTVSNLDQKGMLDNAPTGLLQRLTILAGWSWIALLALRYLL